MPEMTEDEKRKMEEKERKKAEVRRRLEEASKAKKGGDKKGGFMTPERKKKLRALLRKKAADELKKEQERKAEERRKIISQRCGQPRSHDGNEASLQAVCKEYHKRLLELESKKYDLEFEVRQKDFLINELTIQVNDLRGKFVKPSLKKVSKFDKMKIKNVKQDIDFRSGLKTVKKDLKLDADGGPAEKPEWALGGKKEDAEEEEE